MTPDLPTLIAWYRGELEELASHPDAKVEVPQAELRALLDAAERGQATDGGKVVDLANLRELARAIRNGESPDDDDAGAIVDAADRIAHLESLTTWRPIEECGELEEGAEYLVRIRATNGAVWFQVCTWSDGRWSTLRSVTHVHALGPIRGPGE